MGVKGSNNIVFLFSLFFYVFFVFLVVFFKTNNRGAILSAFNLGVSGFLKAIKNIAKEKEQKKLKVAQMLRVDDLES